MARGGMPPYSGAEPECVGRNEVGERSRDWVAGLVGCFPGSIQGLNYRGGDRGDRGTIGAFLHFNNPLWLLIADVYLCFPSKLFEDRCFVI